MVVTMNHGLIAYVHSVKYLAIDYTFKRVQGEFDEWKIVGFLTDVGRRKYLSSLLSITLPRLKSFLLGVIFATLYCDRATTETFEALFTEFFVTVDRCTGKPLKFNVFFPQSPDANLLAILVDAEIAQVLGLGSSLQAYLGRHSHLEGIAENLPRNATDLALLVLKLCYVHFKR